MTTETTDLGALLSRCAARWEGRLVDGCASAGYREITSSRCRVLGPLFEDDGLPISEVGRRIGLSKSTMTTLVRGLERDGFVRVVEDDGDHRVRRLFLTDRSRSLEQILNDGATRLRHRVTATLGPQGQQQLHRTLQRLLDSL